jgi:lysine 2,3-aminomutase
MPVNNHTVLLKGVNDSLETMRDLMRALLRIKVRPYYLFHCDPVRGAGHFRTSVWKGLEIIEGLRGHMSGLGIPTYVVDSPHGGGKIPLMPNYLVSASDDAVILRNYEGMLVRYQAEDKPATIKPTATRGVSSLLQGTKTALVPENTERMKRRRLIVLHGNGHEANGHHNGHLNGNGHHLGNGYHHPELNGHCGSGCDGQDATEPSSAGLEVGVG